MALVKPRALSLDEAVEAVYQQALGGQSVIGAATEYAADIDEHDIRKVIVIGLAELAHRRLARQRRPSEEQEEDSPAGDPADSEAVLGRAASSPRAAKPPRAKAFWRAFLDANYEAADGTRKALRAFTVADAASLRNVSNARADGFVRVRDAMDIAVEALRSRNVETIAELPEADQRKIAEAIA